MRCVCLDAIWLTTAARRPHLEDALVLSPAPRGRQAVSVTLLYIRPRVQYFLVAPTPASTSTRSESCSVHALRDCAFAFCSAARLSVWPRHTRRCRTRRILRLSRSIRFNASKLHLTTATPRHCSPTTSRALPTATASAIRRTSARMSTTVRRWPPSTLIRLGDEDAAAIVRKVVPETDDPTLPTLTVRVLICGSILACIGSAVSQLLFFSSSLRFGPSSEAGREQFGQPGLLPDHPCQSTQCVGPLRASPEAPSGAGDGALPAFASDPFTGRPRVRSQPGAVQHQGASATRRRGLRHLSRLRRGHHRDSGCAKRSTPI